MFLIFYSIALKIWCKCSPSCSSLNILFITLPFSLMNHGITRLYSTIFLVRCLLGYIFGKSLLNSSHVFAPFSISSLEAFLLEKKTHQLLINYVTICWVSFGLQEISQSNLLVYSRQNLYSCNPCGACFPPLRLPQSASLGSFFKKLCPSYVGNTLGTNCSKFATKKVTCRSAVTLVTNQRPGIFHDL